MQQHSKKSQTTLSKESQHMDAYSVIPFILAQKNRQSQNSVFRDLFCVKIYKERHKTSG